MLENIAYLKQFSCSKLADGQAIIDKNTALISLASDFALAANLYMIIP